MQVFYKVTSCFLSVVLILTSMTPSFAQIRNTSRLPQQHIYTVPNENTPTRFSTQVERQLYTQAAKNTASMPEQVAILQEMEDIVRSAELSASEQEQENVDLKTLLPMQEFVRLYKEANQQVLNEALAKCTTDRKSVV